VDPFTMPRNSSSWLTEDMVKSEGRFPDLRRRA
jgi:hypothetical protein